MRASSARDVVADFIVACVVAHASWSRSQRPIIGHAVWDQSMSALHPKADMCAATRDVCFGPIADMAKRENLQLAFTIFNIDVRVSICTIANRSDLLRREFA